MHKTVSSLFLSHTLAAAARQAARAGLALAVLPCAAWAQQSWTTPGSHSYTVPVNVTSVQVDLAGAGGGGGGLDNTVAGAGGAGGALSATVRVTPGDALAVTVGGGGEGATSNFGPRVAGVRQPHVPAPWGGAGGAGASAGGAGGEPGFDGLGFSGGGGGGGGSSMVSFDAGGWAGRSFALQAGGGGGGGGGGGYPAGDAGLYGYDGDGAGYLGAFEATAGGGGGSCFYAATASQVQIIAAALSGGAGGPNETVWPPATGFTRTYGADGQVTITPLAGMIQVRLNSIANWPAGQSAVLQFQAACGGQTYTGSFTYSGAAGTATIDGVPLGSSCTLSQVLPAAPTGFVWGTPVLPSAPVTVGAAAIPVLDIVNSLNTSTVTPVPVPTLGQWALGLMGLALAGVAAPALRRRRA